MKSIMRNPLRRLYDWVLHWAETPYGIPALFILSFAESSFFPIPPDVLLIALCMGAHRRWARFAFWCSLGSVLGGMCGYGIGYFVGAEYGPWLWEKVGWLAHSDGEELRTLSQKWFDSYGAWAVAAAGFTPMPL